MTTRKIIPIASEGFGKKQSDCSEAEPLALMVLGDSMTPEFDEGDVVVIEPGSQAAAGNYILAFHNDEYIFRQLMPLGAGWCLHALNDHYPDMPVADLSVVKGIIVQKSRPGKRSASKSYLN